MAFPKGETGDWIIVDKCNLILSRREVPFNPVDWFGKTQESL